MRSDKKVRAAAAGICLLTAVSFFPSYGAVYTYEESYDWESGTDKYADAFKSADQDPLNGPGIVVDKDSGTGDGPSVSQVTLNEKYHDEFKIYEESMANQFFFYVNVANGGITDEAVTMDIPGNIRYTMEKDGYPWECAPGQPISAHGTYVVKLTAIEDPSLPLAEQKEYKSVFRFRIQDRPPQESESAEQGSVTVSGMGMSASVVLPANSGMQSSFFPVEEPETKPAEITETEASYNLEYQETETGARIPETRENEETQESKETQESGDTLTEAIQPADGEVETGTAEPAISQQYDALTRKYKAVFRNGAEIASSVPDGYIGPGPVQITLPQDMADQAVLTRNDEPLEHSAAIYLEQPGYYHLDLGEGSWSFAICTAVGSLDVYPAPRGMLFKEVSLDGEAVTLVSRDYVLLEQDGQYHFVLEGEAGEKLDVGLKKDTAAPEVQVSIKGGSAVIQYLSDDIKEIRLEKNGELVEGFRANSITKPGSYRLTVTDEAGNESVTSFQLKYQVNSYGIAAVVLVILLLIGGGVFVVHTKKTVKVR